MADPNAPLETGQEPLDVREILDGGAPLDVGGVLHTAPKVRPLSAGFVAQQAGMTDFITGGDGTKRKVEAELSGEGKSDAIARLRELGKDRRDRRDVDSVHSVLADPELDDAGKTEKVAAIAAKRAERGDGDLRDLFTEEVVARATVNTPSEARIHRYIYDSPEEVASSRATVEQLKNEFISDTFDTGVLEVTGDFARSAIMPGFSIDLVNIIRDVTGDNIETSQLNPGASLVAFKQYYRDSPAQTRVELMKGLLSSIEDRAGSLMKNNWELFDYLETLTSNLDPNEAGGLDGEAFATNVWAALDLLPLAGSVAAKSLRGARHILGGVKRQSAMKVLNTGAPNDGLAKAADIVQESVDGLNNKPVNSAADEYTGQPDVPQTMNLNDDTFNEFKVREGFVSKIAKRYKARWFNTPGTDKSASGLANTILEGRKVVEDIVSDWNTELGLGVKVGTRAPKNSRAAASYNPKDNTIYLSSDTLAELKNPRNAVHFARAVETVAHEYGHAVSRQILAKEDAATIKAVDEAYNRFLGGASHTRQALAQRRTGIDKSLLEVMKKKDDSPSKYAVSREEWLADQGARYLLGIEMQHTGKVLKAARKVARNLKRIYKTLTGESVPSAGAVSPEYRAFIESIRLKNPDSVANQRIIPTPKEAVGTPAARQPVKASVTGDPWRGSSGSKKAEEMGTTVGDVIETHVLPKTDIGDVPSAGGLDGVIRALSRTVNRAINFSSDELEAATTGYKARVAQAIEDSPVSAVNKMQVAKFDTGNGVRITQTVQHSDGYGFESIEDAMDAAHQLTQHLDDAVIDIRIKDLTTGTYRKLTKEEAANPDLKGEFAAQFASDHFFGINDVLPTTRVFAENSVKGWMSQYLNKSSVFRTFIDLASNVAADKTELVRAALRDITKPFDTLKRNEQAIILHALDKSEIERRWLEQSELYEMFGGSQRMMDGYNSIRQHADAAYILEDARLIRQLKDKGYRRMNAASDPDSEWYLVRPVSEAEQSKIGSVYDPETGTITRVNTKDIEDAIEQGYNFVESMDFFDVGNARTRFIKSRGVTTDPLPHSGVLRKIEGYIPRRYEVSHVVIKRIKKEVNGQMVAQDIPVRMASTVNQAKRARTIAARADDSDDGAEYLVREARELQDQSGLDPEYFDRTGMEYYRDFGRLSNHRGAEVDYINDEMRAVLSPIDAIEQQRAVISRHIGMDSYLDTAKARWEAKYGKFSPNGKFPRHPRDLKETGIVDDKELFKEAKAYMDHINLVDGTDYTLAREMSNKLMTSIANGVSNLRFQRNGLVTGYLNNLSERVAIEIMQSRHQGIFDHLKTITFLRSIVFNPTRQLILQSQSALNYLGIDYGFKYFVAGRGMKDMTALLAGSVARNSGKWDSVVKDIAVAGDMSKQELVDLIEGFKASGLVDAIDSHQYASTLALGPRNTARSGYTRRVAENLRGFARMSRRIGFDAGESVNVAAAFLAARNKAIREAAKGRAFIEGYNPKLPWNAQHNLDIIGGYARSLSFNMNKAGAQRYQKGLMGVFFQFYSHVIKSTQALTPKWVPIVGKMSDKTFSETERMRIALLNATLFGPAGGYGLVSAYENFVVDQGIDVPKDVDEFIKGGVLEAGVNTIIQLADDPDETSRVVFSEGMAPFSGVGGGLKGAAKAFNAIALNDPSIMSVTKAFHQLQSGAPSLTTAGSTMELLERAAMLGGDVIDGTQDDPMPAINAALRWFPVYNNYMRGKIALKLGEFHTQYGNPTVRAAAGEAYAKMVLGLRTEREVEVGELLDDVRGSYPQLLDKAGPQRHLDDEARRMYSDLKVRMLAFTPEEAWNSTEMWEAIKEDRELKKAVLTPVEYHYLMERFLHYWTSDTRSNREVKLTEHLAKGFTSGYLPVDKRITRRIERMDFQGKDALMEWLYSNLDISREDLYNDE